MEHVLDTAHLDPRAEQLWVSFLKKCTEVTNQRKVEDADIFEARRKELLFLESLGTPQGTIALDYARMNDERLAKVGAARAELDNSMIRRLFEQAIGAGLFINLNPADNRPPRTPGLRGVAADMLAYSDNGGLGGQMGAASSYTGTSTAYSDNGGHGGYGGYVDFGAVFSREAGNMMYNNNGGYAGAIGSTTHYPVMASFKNPGYAGPDGFAAPTAGLDDPRRATVSYGDVPTSPGAQATTASNAGDDESADDRPVKKAKTSRKSSAPSQPKVRKSRAAALDGLPAGGQMQFSDVASHISIAQFPMKKDEAPWYMFQCPLCNRHFSTAHGIYGHLSQTDADHLGLFTDGKKSFKQAVVLSGTLVVGLTNAEAEAHNKAAMPSSEYTNKRAINYAT